MSLYKPSIYSSLATGNDTCTGQRDWYYAYWHEERDGGESVYKYCSELGDDVLAQNRIFLYVLKVTVIQDPLDGDGDIRT